MDTIYHKPEYISLLADSVLNEAWVQDLIAADPSILGLGQLTLKAKEHRQKRAGKLDLLLQDEDPDSNQRYEVEVQLGPTDESHIIRTIEYWDFERRRYPQYDHCAVLVAEDITGRFLNVIGLFNGTIPLVAVQMRALRVEGKLTIVFTKVVDALSRGPVDEDEGLQLPATREDWLRTNPDALKLADEILALARQFESALALRYNKQYLTFSKDGVRANFISLTPKKRSLDIKIPGELGEPLFKSLEEAGLDVQFKQKDQYTRISVTAEDFNERAGLLAEVLKNAYDQYLKD